MKLTVYIKKELVDQVNRFSKVSNKTRNSIVSEALEQWIKGREFRPWPENFFDFEPIDDVPNFKSLRKGRKN